jgi:hypothetical protein
MQGGVVQVPRDALRRASRNIGDAAPFANFGKASSVAFGAASVARFVQKSVIERTGFGDLIKAAVTSSFAMKNSSATDRSALCRARVMRDATSSDAEFPPASQSMRSRRNTYQPGAWHRLAVLLTSIRPG